MNPQPKIYVAGHRGMVGSAIVRQLKAAGHDNIVTRTHAELDLTNQAAVNAFFAAEKPDQVYLAAAKVGGIYANNTYPAQFIYENLMIQANIIQAAHANDVQQLLFLGSSCIYPKAVPQPMRESLLALGATRWETTKCIVRHAALPGVLAAVVLGFSRAFGETLAVMMVVGNVPRTPSSIFDGAYPLPALIANNYSEMMSVPLYDAALMTAALILLVVVLCFNVLARLVINRLTKQRGKL